MPRIDFAVLPQDVRQADYGSQESAAYRRVTERLAQVEIVRQAWRQAVTLADLLAEEYSQARKTIHFGDPVLKPLKQRLELAIEVQERLEAEKLRLRELAAESWEQWWQLMLGDV